MTTDTREIMVTGSDPEFEETLWAGEGFHVWSGEIASPRKRRTGDRSRRSVASRFRLAYKVC